MSNNINCIIVEDQIPAQRVLEEYISRLDHLTLIATCQSVVEALAVMQQQTIDLLFLDIHLPQMDGFSFLRNLSVDQHVIVTTAYPEHAAEGFELDVLDYLLKPFSYERFLKAVSKIPANEPVHESAPNTADSRYIFIRQDRELVRVDLEEVIHVRSDGNYLHVSLAEARYHLQGTLQSWQDRLQNSDFVRVHKSHLVNLKFIDRISGNQISTPAGPVPIGRSYRADLFARTIEEL